VLEELYFKVLCYLKAAKGFKDGGGLVEIRD
jgi:hypothetical protein